jgi:N-acyl homoserine lactone hydrolase
MAPLGTARNTDIAMHRVRWLRYDARMQRLFLALALATVSLAPSAQVPALRLYVFDCGNLLGSVPAVAYLIVHPRGTLLWEAGTVPDRFAEGSGTGEKLPEVLITYKAAPGRSLRSQLAALGYTPAQITFFATSHYHFDHIANGNDYVGSTWLVQRAEREAMFAPGPLPFAAEPAFFSSLTTAKTIILEGDHDVFGDGTVVLKSSPGHTPGHQVLFLKLQKTGPLVIGGDIYHAPEERLRPLETVPAMDATELAKSSRVALEAFVKQTGAAFWIEHDAAAFSRQRKAPAYYD